MDNRFSLACAGNKKSINWIHHSRRSCWLHDMQGRYVLNFDWAVRCLCWFGLVFCKAKWINFCGLHLLTKGLKGVVLTRRRSMSQDYINKQKQYDLSKRKQGFVDLWTTDFPWLVPVTKKASTEDTQRGSCWLHDMQGMRPKILQKILTFHYW